jgi:hypothetical protein
MEMQIQACSYQAISHPIDPVKGPHLMRGIAAALATVNVF